MLNGHPKKYVGAALIQLAGQLAVSNVELKQRMARRQCHIIHLGNIPSADNMPATVGVAAYACDQRLDLIDRAAIRAGP
jgi:hypothetical protein